MKKLSYSLLLPILLVGCAKKSTVPPLNTTIQYVFTSSQPSTYVITYIDNNHNQISLNYSGSAWSKTILVDSAKFAATHYGEVFLDIKNTEQVSPEITGNISIYINNNLSNTENIKVLSADGEYQVGTTIINNNQH